MEMNVKNLNSQAIDGVTSISEELLSCPFNEPLIHQLVTAYFANSRAGTKAQKTRAEVSGGGRKPWKQKGMGRARAGTIRSPLWRGGGVTFAAKPRCYAQKVNKKMYRAGMLSILAELFRQERIEIVSGLEVSSHKTKEFLAKIIGYRTNPGERLLIILHDLDDNLYYAVRNLFWISILDAYSVNPADLVRHQKILVTAEALKQIEEQFV